MPAERVWANITYFLERVIPVADECKVKMACHPHDPAVPRATSGCAASTACSAASTG